MTLHTWLHTENMRPSAFAKLIGRSHTTVLRWLDGSFVPSSEAIRDIFTATGGKVTANDLLGQKAQ